MSDSERLTGTSDRPIERIPDQPSTLGDWAVLLGGPAIWISHFMLVYLLAEASCAAVGSDALTFIGDDTLVVLTVVATVIAAAACGTLAWVAWRRTRGGRRDIVDLSRAGLLLAVGSFVGVIAVGAPALVLSPVC